jgi:hypothetical protein
MRKSVGISIFTRSMAPSTDAVDSMFSFTHLNATHEPQKRLMA